MIELNGEEILSRTFLTIDSYDMTDEIHTAGVVLSVGYADRKWFATTATRRDTELVINTYRVAILLDKQSLPPGKWRFLNAVGPEAVWHAFVEAAPWA